MSLYDFGRPLVGFFFKTFYRLEIVGRDNFNGIAEKEGILLCSNHVSNFDPPAIGYACPRPLSYMAKAELFKIPLLKQLIEALNAFPVHRGTSDRQAIKTSIRVLNEGGALIMFPEGRRSKDGKIGEAKPGIGLLALKTTAHIVPVAVVGRYRLFGKTKIIIGEPIDMTKMRENRGKPIDVANVIMDHIKRLAATHQ
ncbi:lysophospholipid acyltransferase family protein [Camelliibacillus cellulosilyticus]|uniref:Lysophospholipid acyltransferase family protein n=1 Tax=Camelliibacillus cellulosilyticus TaxID=2174486 RepID=A0ABV9GMB3_9BACL